MLFATCSATGVDIARLNSFEEPPLVVLVEQSVGTAIEEVVWNKHRVWLLLQQRQHEPFGSRLDILLRSPDGDFLGQGGGVATRNRLGDRVVVRQ